MPNVQKRAAALAANKFILQSLLVKWKSDIGVDTSILADKKLCAMIGYMKEYTKLDSSASYAKEGQLYKKIIVGMDKYSKDLEAKMLKSEDPKLAQSLSMMSDLNEMFVYRRDGYMKKPSFKDHHIHRHDNQIMMGKEMKDKIGKMVSCKDVPLFSNKPSCLDLQSGNMKDSKIRAALGTIVQNNPEYIKESMLDNKDGTVTVRLFQEVQPVDQGEKPKNHTVYRPVYVTVDKSVPEAAVEQDSLWVGIYEKAIAASGMFYGDKNEPVGRPVPSNIDELYSKYKSLPKTEWPTKQECPWLINDNGELHKWQPSYDHINNIGNNGKILECILGEQGRSNVKDLEYTPQQNEAYKKDQVMNVLYSKIIRTKTETRQDQLRIENMAKRYANGNQQSEIKNMQLCAALLSSVSRNDAERYFDNIKCDEKGKITSFPLSFEQKFLEQVESQVGERIGKEIKNVGLKSCEDMLKEATLQAEHNVKNNPDLETATLATETSLESVQNMSKVIRTEGENVFSEIKNYTKRQENIFEELETTLQRGLHIIAGTGMQQGENQKEQNKDGFLSNDSYSVVGVSKEILNGKEYRFVHIAGASNFGYDFDKIPPQPMENKEADSNGIVKVELNHFCNTCNQLTITGRELKSSELPQDMLTRNTISQYNNFFSYFEEQLDKDIKDLKELPNKEEFESLKKMFGAKKGELTKNIGKDMKSVSFKDMKDKIGKCVESLEQSEKGMPKQLKTLKRMQNVIRLYENGMKNPKALLLGSIEQSMKKDNMLDAYVENNFVKTVVNSHGDILKLQQGMDKVSSRFAKSSKEFTAVKDSLSELDKLMKESKAGVIPRRQYTNAMENLLSNANKYLKYKENQRGMEGGIIKANSDLEKERIEMVQGIKEYASCRCNLINHQNLRDALKFKTFQQLTSFTNGTKETDKQKEFKKIVNSNTLNTILEKADDKTIAKILKNPDAAKEFADKVNLQMTKTNGISPLERYKNAALKSMDDKENSFFNRDNLARVFLADVLISMKPDMKLGELRKYEKDFFSMALSSDTMSRLAEENDITKLDKNKALKMLNRYGSRFKSEMKQEMENMKNKALAEKSEKVIETTDLLKEDLGMEKA